MKITLFSLLLDQAPVIMVFHVLIFKTFIKSSSDKMDELRVNCGDDRVFEIKTL